MDAPLYPPARAFTPLRRLPRVLSTRDTAIAALKANPQAWAIVLSEIPNIEQRVGGEQIRPHLGNFSFQSLIQFGVVKPDALARIDAKLKTLGEVR